jgi:murein DD-endopeptidase MepM/ murein hydrolase activator NlpD
MVEMRKLCSKHMIRPLVVAVSAAVVAACSSDLERFSDFQSVTDTASVSQPADANESAVNSSKLAGSSISSNTKPSWQTGYAAHATQQSAEATYRQPARSTRATGTIAVQPGQTMFSIAKSNGLTLTELEQANNLQAPYTLRVGQRLVVPGVETPASPSASFRPANGNPKQQNFAGNGIHRVSAGETLFAVGRKYNVHPYKIARHNNLSEPYSLSVGQQLRIPSGDGFQAAAPTQPVGGQVVEKSDAQGTSLAKDQSQVSQPVEKVEPTISDEQTPAVSESDNGAGFRWPVRGRVISKYGSKPGGTRNEGINIAVPEGTDIRATQSGVVAYAGNELKGYGNLVLLRHQDGWVSAYAHAKEVFVKRGDTVRRGQVIAKAGSTGSVTSPQLHFELRKGASAVDPQKYLSSATASN